MAFTDSSDLFGSVHEDAFNRVMAHIMRKRPSLFNYGTQWVADDWRKRLCVPPAVDDLVLRPTNRPGVLVESNPVVTVEKPLPLVGTEGNYGLNFAAQILELSVDFHPSNKKLPLELDSKLAPQQFALFARACAGIGCPGERGLDDLPPLDEQKPNRDPIPLPTEDLTCFCLDLFVSGHFEVTGLPTIEFVEMKVDKLELVDVEPDGLESAMECYLSTLLHLVLLPRLRLPLQIYEFGLFEGFSAIELQAAPGVPHNPAVEEDRVKVFVDMVGP